MRWILVLALLVGCKAEEEPEDTEPDPGCDPGDVNACVEGLVCEPIVDNDDETPPFDCAAPILLKGDVFDLLSDDAVSGARVVPVDLNGAVGGRVGITDETGAYELVVSVPRDGDGAPSGEGSVTLRTDAAGYESFPGGLRTALPVSLSDYEETEDGLVIQSELTSIGLLPIDTPPAGSISGTAEVPDNNAGVLVVAELADGTALTALADATGDYEIFNVPDGDWTVDAYAQGVAHDSTTASVSGDPVIDVDLSISGPVTTTVDGTVQLVNAGGLPGTSVILVVESTFDPFTARGATPPGLRAPGGGVAPNIDGGYSFGGVPDGTYVVLAAFENDGLVRDPDTDQGGTELQEITVAGQDVTVDGFKVTEALEVFGPGADGRPEVVGPTPTLSWKDDSGEQSYDIVVFDRLGELVWEHTIDGVSGSDPAVPYAGPALEDGEYYQFRVTSIDNGGTPISRTQDLDGVFRVDSGM